MNKEIADRWVTELRSGNYPQTTGMLHVIESTTERPTGFCCLGVLCEMAVKDGVIDPPTDGAESNFDEEVIITYAVYGDGEGSALPDHRVLEYAELRTETGSTLEYQDVSDLLSSEEVVAIFGRYPEDVLPDRQVSLVDLNDNGVDFGLIADIIETHWEKL